MIKGELSNYKLTLFWCFISAEALRGMEAVAEHINEMQKIYEEYGNVFDDLIRLYKDSHRMVR